MNNEHQHSDWLVDRAHTIGWRDPGGTGSREEVLAPRAEVWTDVRTLSLRSRDV